MTDSNLSNNLFCLIRICAYVAYPSLILFWEISPGIFWEYGNGLNCELNTNDHDGEYPVFASLFNSTGVSENQIPIGTFLTYPVSLSVKSIPFCSTSFMSIFSSSTNLTVFESLFILIKSYNGIRILNFIFSSALSCFSVDIPVMHEFT